MKDIDVDVINKIKAEALGNSELMDTVSWLSDVFGPRLTGSPTTAASADWAVKKLRSWGIDNVHLELWAGNKPGWQSDRFVFRGVKPYPFAITAVPSTWSVGTKGHIPDPQFEWMHTHLRTCKSDLRDNRTAFLPDRYFTLSTPANFKPHATRLTDAQLKALASGQSPPRALRIDQVTYDPTADAQWLIDQGVAALLFVGPGDGGEITMSGRGGIACGNVPCVKVSAESYGRIAPVWRRNCP